MELPTTPSNRAHERRRCPARGGERSEPPGKRQCAATDRERRREGYPPEGSRPRSGARQRKARSRSDAPRLTSQRDPHDRSAIIVLHHHRSPPSSAMRVQALASASPSSAASSTSRSASSSPPRSATPASVSSGGAIGCTDGGVGVNADGGYDTAPGRRRACRQW